MPHRRGSIALLAVTVVMAALLAPPAAASHQSTAGCPDYLEPQEITRGMNGTGYTVAEDRTRRRFDAEVLGVLPNALGPGRDMIIIEATGSVIDEHGGVWAGMSGSPIFVDDKLLGAVAFGLAFGPSEVVGVTPASEMFKVMEYPEASRSAATPGRVRLTRTMRNRIAFSSGMETQEVAGSMRQLPLPVAVSGLSPAGLQRFESIVRRENLPLIPYAGNAGAARTTVANTELRPGDNIGVAASYGDITFAGVGTVTFVCDGHAMAFGHPFIWEGETLLGANAASSIAVIEDTFGGYELASIDELVGIVDQDRFAGVRGTFGLEPHRIPISSSIHALNTNRSREGLTEVMSSELMSFLAYYHLASNLAMTMDQYSEGSADLSWTITGTDADGQTWSLHRDNLYSSEWGIPDEATFEISNAVNAILYNRFEDVEFTSVEIDGSADDDVKQYTIGALEVSRDGVTYRDKEQIKAQPGDTIYLRLEMQPYDGDVEILEMSVQLPPRMRSDATLDIMGGGETFGEEEICIYDPTQCTGPSGKRIDSFEDLLASLQDKPRNNEVVATLRGGMRGRTKGRTIETVDQVVKGQAFLYIRIPGGRGGKGGPVLEGEEVSDPPDH